MRRYGLDYFFSILCQEITWILKQVVSLEACFGADYREFNFVSICHIERTPVLLLQEDCQTLSLTIFVTNSP